MRMTVRIPDDLAAQLKEEAKEQERSINGQLVYILRLYFTTKVTTRVEWKAPKPMPDQPVHPLERA